MTLGSAWLSPFVLGLSLAWLGSATAQAQVPAPSPADAQLAAPPPPAADAPVSDPPAQPPAAYPPAYPPAQPYPYTQPQAYPYGYPAQPYPYVLVPEDSREARRAAKRAAREEKRRLAELMPQRVFLWRLLFEAGGTVEFGRVEHFVDGARIRTDEPAPRSRSLHGALDFRATLQRTFGRWFALGGQLGWTNWQSDQLEMQQRWRSNYLSIAAMPELRLPFGECRRCPALFVAGRVGLAVAWQGDRQFRGRSIESVDTGVGAVWGARAGLEIPVGSRARIRFSTGYEGALLRHRASYRDVGSEVLTFRIQRPLTTLGVAVGL
jgi:hypothetical protein